MKKLIYAERMLLGTEISITLAEKQSNGTWVAEPITMSRLEDGLYAPPTFQLDNDTAQQLIDELWKCGLRPSEGTGSAGSLKATQEHLDDMKKITFSALSKLGVKVDN